MALAELGFIIDGRMRALVVSVGDTHDDLANVLVLPWPAILQSQLSHGQAVELLEWCGVGRERRERKSIPSKSL